MKQSLLVAALLTTVLAEIGCTDVGKATISAYGRPHSITLYAANGTVIKQWFTDGKINSAGSSDGYEFLDRATGRMVQVSGTVVVETL